jgi:hypothetical protein
MIDLGQIAITMLWVMVIILLIILALAIFIGWLIYKFAKKNPALSIFLFVVLLVLGTLEVVTIEGFLAGVATYVTALISLLLSYNKLEDGLKR